MTNVHRNDIEAACEIAPDPERVIRPWQERQGRCFTPRESKGTTVFVWVVIVIASAACVLHIIARSGLL